MAAQPDLLDVGITGEGTTTMDEGRREAEAVVLGLEAELRGLSVRFEMEALARRLIECGWAVRQDQGGTYQMWATRDAGRLYFPGGHEGRRGTVVMLVEETGAEHTDAQATGERVVWKAVLSPGAPVEMIVAIASWTTHRSIEEVLGEGDGDDDGGDLVG